MCVSYNNCRFLVVIIFWLVAYFRFLHIYLYIEFSWFFVSHLSFFYCSYSKIHSFHDSTVIEWIVFYAVLCKSIKALTCEAMNRIFLGCFLVCHWNCTYSINVTIVDCLVRFKQLKSRRFRTSCWVEKVKQHMNWLIKAYQAKFSQLKDTLWTCVTIGPILSNFTKTKLI